MSCSPLLLEEVVHASLCNHLSVTHQTGCMLLFVLSLQNCVKAHFFGAFVLNASILKFVAYFDIYQSVLLIESMCTQLCEFYQLN